MNNYRQTTALILVTILLAMACSEDLSPAEQVDRGVTRTLERSVPDFHQAVVIEPRTSSEDAFDVIIAIDVFALNETSLRSTQHLRHFLYEATASLIWGHDFDGVEPYLETTRYQWHDPVTGELMMVIEMEADTRRSHTWVDGTAGSRTVHDNHRAIPELADLYEDNLRDEHLETAILVRQR